MRMQPGEATPAALYNRSVCGDRGNSLEAQLRDLRRYAWRNDLDPVRV